MTYEQTQDYIEQNRSKIDDKASGLKYMGLVVSTDNAELREKVRIFKEMHHNGVGNDFLLKQARLFDANLQVYFIGENPDQTPVAIPFSDYLKALAQKPV